MPRRARMYLPGFPCHVIQRSNNRGIVFYDTDGFHYYLSLWAKLSVRYSVDVHAYVLMTNHIHFLATPHEKDSLSLVMKNVGSQYAQYVNKTHHRTGTLWEGRHKASVIDSVQYLLTCYRYIEMNPVRAAMVDKPEEYPWSSNRANAWGDSSWLNPHAEYLQLASNKNARLKAYRKLFKHQLNETTLYDIRTASHYCQPFGSELFRQKIEKRLNRPLGYAKRGRPKCIAEG